MPPVARCPSPKGYAMIVVPPFDSNPTTRRRCDLVHRIMSEAEMHLGVSLWSYGSVTLYDAFCGSNAAVFSSSSELIASAIREWINRGIRWQSPSLSARVRDSSLSDLVPDCIHGSTCGNQCKRQRDDFHRDNPIALWLVSNANIVGDFDESVELQLTNQSQPKRSHCVPVYIRSEQLFFRSSKINEPTVVQRLPTYICRTTPDAVSTPESAIVARSSLPSRYLSSYSNPVFRPKYRRWNPIRQRPRVTRFPMDRTVSFKWHTREKYTNVHQSEVVDGQAVIKKKKTAARLRLVSE